MNRQTPIELTNLCVISDGDRILVEEKGWRGRKGIIFPGGHVEQGESLLDAVVREMKEETGLTIENPIPFGFKDWIEEDGSRYLVLMYKTDKFSGQLQSSEEGRVFWMTREEFETADVMWDMQDILKIHDSDQYSELFYPAGSESGTVI